MAVVVDVDVDVAVAAIIESPPMRHGWALLLCWFLPAPALAAGQGESAVSAGPTAILALEGKTRAGAGADLRALRGLSDSWSARLGLQAGWISSSGAERSSRLIAPSLGLTFAADALGVVPFADAGLSFADLRGGAGPSQQRLGGQLGLGADYFVTRHFTLTLLGHADYFPILLSGPSTSAPVRLSLALHLGRVF